MTLRLKLLGVFHNAFADRNRNRSRIRAARILGHRFRKPLDVTAAFVVDGVSGHGSLALVPAHSEFGHNLVHHQRGKITAVELQGI